MMKRKDVVKGFVFCILVAVILFGGMALKAEAGSLKLSMADFTTNGEMPNGTTDLGFSKVTSSGYIIGTAPSGSSATLIAPVRFSTVPSKVKKVTLYVADNNGSYNFSTQFFGVDMTTGNILNLGSASASDNGMTLQTLILTPNQKLKTSYQYYLVVWIYSDQYFYGAQVNW